MHCQALDAGSSAALPEGIRQELEKIEDSGGLRFLQDMVAQVRVRTKEVAPFTSESFCLRPPIADACCACTRAASSGLGPAFRCECMGSVMFGWELPPAPGLPLADVHCARR